MKNMQNFSSENSSAAFSKYVRELNVLSVHSLVMRRHDREIARLSWQPYDERTKHISYSVSKSFTAVGVLFAIQDGLCSLDTKICDILADEIAFVPDGRIQQATLFHLLTMTYGFYEPGIQKFYLTDDWIKEALSLHPQHDPGSVFFYDNRCPFLCSAIVQKLTHMDLLSYLKMKLFNPLEISSAEIAWEKNCQGYNKGSYGLSITTEAMAKLGQLILNRGRWNGVQLLSSEYIDMLFKIHIDTNVNDEDSDENKLGYSFYFWHCRMKNAIRAEGLFGQFLIILPRQDMVIALHSGIDNEHKDAVLSATWNFIKAFENTADAPLIPPAEQECFNQLHIPLPSNDNTICEAIIDREFAFARNSLDINKFKISSADESNLKFSITLQQKEYICQLYPNQWQKIALGGKNDDDFDSCNTVFFNNPYMAYGWKNNILTVKIVYNQGVFIDYLHFKAVDNKLQLHYLPTPTFTIRAAEQTITSV